MQKYATFVENNLKKLSKSTNCRKVRGYFHYADKYRGVAHSICKLKFNIPNEIPVVFHNGLSFIIRESTNKFEGQFEYLGENTENYKKFSDPIEK